MPRTTKHFRHLAQRFHFQLDCLSLYSPGATRPSTTNLPSVMQFPIGAVHDSRRRQCNVELHRSIASTVVNARIRIRRATYQIRGRTTAGGTTTSSYTLVRARLKCHRSCDLTIHKPRRNLFSGTDGPLIRSQLPTQERPNKWDSYCDRHLPQAYGHRNHGTGGLVSWER